MKEVTPISSPNASTRSSPSPEHDSPVINLLSLTQQLTKHLLIVTLKKKKTKG